MNKSLLVEKIMHPDVLKSIKKSVSRLAAKPENRGGRIPCEYCRANEKFENEHEVLEHIKSMHPIQCPGTVVCNEIGKTQNQHLNIIYQNLNCQ